MPNKLPGLNIQIAADVAQLRQDMAKAQRTVKRGVDGISRQAAAARRALGGIAGALVSGAAVRKIIAATSEQEAAVKQLEQGLASTGGVVGQSLDELVKKAAELQKATTFGDEEIIRAQSQLLSFTSIVGEEFDKTIELAADLSTRFGFDLKSAILQLGKALNDPVANLSALSRAGIQFSAAQKDQIKALVESNRLLDAQKIILAELETQFGGSARAARDTFGGALEGLSGAFNDLFEVRTGLEGAQESIEGLTALLQDPATLAAVNDLISGVVGLTGAVVELGSGAINATRGLAEFFAARNGADGLEGAIEDIQRLQDLQANLAGSPGIASRIGSSEDLVRGLVGFSSVEDLQGYLDDVQSRVESTFAQIGDARNDGNDEAFLQLWVRLRSEIEAAIAAKKQFVVAGGDSSDVAEPSAGLPPVVDPAVVKAQNKALAEVQAVLKANRSAMQVYQDSVRSLDIAFQTGKLSQDDYNTALEVFKQRLNESTPEFEAMKEAQAEATAVINANKTALERLNEELERARGLAAAGVLPDDELEKTKKRIEEAKEKLVEGGDEMSKFAERAAENMQDAFADFLFDPFDDGLDGMLDSFAKALQRMAAEAAAAQIFEALGVEEFLKGVGSGSSGSGSDAGGFLSSLASLFSYEGGGFTGAGSRTGGLDGRGGFLAMVHPNETVVDHTRGQALGNTNHISINYNGTGNRSEDRRAAGQIGRDISAAIQNSQRYS